MNLIAPLLFLLMWSSGAIFVKLGLMSASVWTFLAIRSTGALLVLLIVLIIWFPRELRMTFFLPRRTILGALAIGILLQAGYQGSYFLAIANDLSPGVLTIILGAQPLLTPWLAREHVSPIGRLLLLVGFLGLVVAVLGMRETNQGSLTGTIFGVTALLAITLGTALQKRLGIAVTQSIIWQYIGSAVVFLTVLLVAGWHADLNPSFVISATWMIVVVSVGANVLLLVMLTRYDASKIGNVFYFVPIITMIADRYLYGSRITSGTVVGAAIVVVASVTFAKMDFWLPRVRAFKSRDANRSIAGDGRRQST